MHLPNKRIVLLRKSLFFAGNHVTVRRDFPYSLCGRVLSGRAGELLHDRIDAICGNCLRVLESKYPHDFEIRPSGIIHTLTPRDTKEEEQMTYTLFWLSGETEIVKGKNIADAMTHSGYGNGALPSLDFYAPGDVREAYTWNGSKWNWNYAPKPLTQDTHLG